MRDVTGITGAAPTWLSVMNYLHDRFGSGQILRPPDAALSKVTFPGAVDPSRKEWFVPGNTADWIVEQSRRLQPADSFAGGGHDHRARPRHPRERAAGNSIIVRGSNSPLADSDRGLDQQLQ